MIGHYVKDGLFVFQIPGYEYSKQNIAALTNNLLMYILGTCEISPEDVTDGHGVRGTTLINKKYDKTCIGIYIDSERAVKKVAHQFKENELFYLTANSGGIQKCNKTKEEYIDCLEKVCEMLDIEERKILPKDYPFKEPAVKEKEFMMYRSSNDLRSIVSLYNALEGKTRTLYSNGKGRYGLSVKIFGEDIVYYKSEYMLEMSPFDTKMSPFNEKMAAELSSLYR